MVEEKKDAPKIIEESDAGEGAEKSDSVLRFNKAVKIGPETTYANVPVSSFGEMLLRKLGWKEGHGLGKSNKKGLVQPIEFIPRHQRLGLGARAIPTMKIRGGDKGLREGSEKGKLNSSNYKYLDEKIKDRTKPGTEVVINKGKYEGMYGRVLGYDENSETILCVELLANDQKIKIHKDDVSIPVNEEKKNSPKEKHKRDKAKLKWVLPGILVRVISKDYAGGKYYNRKLGVEDVPDKWSFVLVTESGNFLENLMEDDIETVMPQLMEDVIIVKGKNRGEVGKLLIRDKKKDEVRIQLYDNSDIVYKCTQDDCCALYNKKLYS